jgi:hypothetical protein
MLTNGQTVAGVTVPDPKVAREATELVREPATGMVYRPRRVFWFGSLQGRNRGLSFDPELLCMGAMFHDLGLNQQFRRNKPALRGGQRRRRPPLPAGPRGARGHHPPGLGSHHSAHHAGHPVAHGTRGRTRHRRIEYDVLGIGYHDISDADRAEITAAPALGLQAQHPSRRSPKASRPSRKRRSATSKQTS